jgi:hypothetical protein
MWFRLTASCSSQKLKAIDREPGQLSKKMRVAKAVDPSKQKDRSRFFFRETVVTEFVVQP